MNSNDETDEASRGSEPSTSNSADPRNSEDREREPPQGLCISPTGSNIQDVMKRAAARQLIERYFYQIVDGCGNPNCDNHYCASSGEARNLTPNEAAAEAIKLFYKDAKLCDNLSIPNKVPRTDANTCPTGTSTGVTKTDGNEKESTEPPVCDTKSLEHYNGVPLTEELICQLCEECIATKDCENLKRTMIRAIVQPTILARSFPKIDNHKVVKDKESEKDTDAKTSNKESKAMCSSSDPDKDIDSVARPSLDVASCRRAFQYLSKIPLEEYNAGVVLALTELVDALEVDLKRAKKLKLSDIVNCFVIAFELPVSGSSDYLDLVLPEMCRAVNCLPLKGQAKLAKMWGQSCQESLRRILETIQQFITVTVITTNYTRHYFLQDDERIINATKLLKILYYANILAGEMDQNRLREEPVQISHNDPLGDAFDHLYPIANKHSKLAEIQDPLAVELDVNILDARKPLLKFEEFYNEPLSEAVEMDKDFANYKNDVVNTSKKFSFMEYPFLLTAATKSLGLYYDNRIRMYSERRVSVFHAVIGGASLVPFLRLKVRRTHLIEDALVELEMIAMERALDLKKQLVVEFEGEQGVDEGGVSKEFFQLIVEEIFNADYGMFTCQSETRTVWFNPTSFETEAQFTLIGIVLGLAIYNNVILAVNFPMVVYRKLMGKKGTFEDLADWNPTLYKGLLDMLQYEGSDLEEIYYQTFRICYQDVFGNNIFHDLQENGDEIFVTQDNKKEFVDLYADFLLNKSVDTQFKAFRRGFVMVTDESPLGELFRPEEIETLVCGSKNFDFKELEQSTEYDGGYTAESQTVQDFWNIVHTLSTEDKRKLLQFTTGSDRVPVGGMSHLKLVIARNGPDTDHLPTAHTCFNVLLLPEYSNMEKLKDRLMKAINYSKGFGML